MDTATMNHGEAAAFRAAHDSETRSLSRKSGYELAAIERSELAAHGMGRIYGGPVTKDEYVRSILELRYPLARLNEAIHVLHHEQPWPDCSWCQQAATRPTGTCWPA